MKTAHQYLYIFHFILSYLMLSFIQLAIDNESKKSFFEGNEKRIDKKTKTLYQNMIYRKKLRLRTETKPKFLSFTAHILSSHFCLCVKL